MGDGGHHAAAFLPDQAVRDEQPVAQQRLQRMAHLRAFSLQRRVLVDEGVLHAVRAVADQDALGQHPGRDHRLLEMRIEPDIEEAAPRPPQQLRQRQPLRRAVGEGRGEGHAGQARSRSQSRWMRSGPKLCTTGMTCSRLTFTRAGRVATQWTVSAMSLGGQRVGPGIDARRLGLVAAEADAGELGAADQAGLDIGHPHLGAMQVGAQVVAELADEGLGRAIDVAAG